MEVKRFWILMPLIPLVPLLVVLWLLTETRGATWNIVLMVILVVAFFACLIVRGTKLRCPSCGEPLAGIVERYLLRHEREIYCPGCGQHIEIVK